MYDGPRLGDTKADELVSNPVMTPSQRVQLARLIASKVGAPATIPSKFSDTLARTYNPMLVKDLRNLLAYYDSSMDRTVGEIFENFWSIEEWSSPIASHRREPESGGVGKIEILDTAFQRPVSSTEESASPVLR
jgi:hypothetical protein